MGIIDKAKDALPDNLDELKGKATEVANAVKNHAQGVAAKLDDKADELSQKDGIVGTVAGKAHELLDKIDGDDTPVQQVVDAVSHVADATKDAAGNMVDSVQHTASDAVDAVQDAAGHAVDAVDDATS
jgi:methyl-accepting chemotaxis protein